MAHATHCTLANHLHTQCIQDHPQQATGRWGQRGGQMAHATQQVACILRRRL